jgi:hypothetical protein
MRTLAAAALAALLAAAPRAGASFHTFQIEQVFSNADGTVQYVMLHETAGLDGQSFLAGQTFTSTHAGAVKTLTLPSNLPGSATAARRFVIATRGFAAQTKAQAKVDGYPPPPPPPDPPPTPPPVASAQPDFIMPDGFIPTDGGTLNYAGVDQMTFGPLPTDGVTALDRSGLTGPGTAVNFAGFVTAPTAQPVTLVEFYHAALDHYFVSALQPDLDALDSGRIPGWTRTGGSFKVYATASLGGAGVNAVCRYLIPPQHGNSHFFSASPDECNAVFGKIASDPNYSGYIEESASAFFVALPGVSNGTCPAGTQVVYRLFNNRVDANHRYTTDPAVKAAMVARGYVAEGYGPDAAIMCAPLS